jgi:hypothetical protein
MFKPANGLVISYNYFWAREHDRHEEAGRKARPVCVQIIVAEGEHGTIVALFPITSSRRTLDELRLQFPIRQHAASD